MSGGRQRVLQVHVDGRATWRSDELTAEEPLEIRVNQRPVSVTMRTPGSDFDLAVGFLVTEGVIDSAQDVTAMRMCPQADAGDALNVVEVTLRDETLRTPERAFYTTSSCGICGKASIEAVRTESRYDVADDPVRVSAALLASLPERLRAAQKMFARTGGLHAAALFAASGELRCIREDVGRHNAFDKVIGWAATQRLLPLRGHVILASGRASFELTQKALMAGIPVVAAVSAPSHLAVELARASGMTLVGFLRGAQMNVYAGHSRVADAAQTAPG